MREGARVLRVDACEKTGSVVPPVEKESDGS